MVTISRENDFLRENAILLAIKNDVFTIILYLLTLLLSNPFKILYSFAKNMKLILLNFLIFFTSCDPVENQAEYPENNEESIVTGAGQIHEYLPILSGKSVGFVVNHTAMVNETHLIDTLLSLNVSIHKIFAPEHGFRGTADAGEAIKDNKDPAIGIPVMSLYGKKKKPSKEDLEGIEIMVFDMQDVGVRFYTYISTMTYIMESCAENGIPLLILDRPNPNGHYVDGPILLPENRSFIGMHPVPVVHGMTIGEYAQMVNGEYWLKDSVQASIQIIPCKNYDHTGFYNLPVRPSPNLPNMRSIYLYPYVCFFEGTAFSVGRGTEFPFQIIGHPDYRSGNYQFTPESMPGATNAKFIGQLCTGISFTDLSTESLRKKNQLDFSTLLDVYKEFEDKQGFFIKSFRLLAGTDELQQQIEAGLSEMEIRITWEEGLTLYKKMRKPYLLYKDFE